MLFSIARLPGYATGQTASELVPVEITLGADGVGRIINHTDGLVFITGRIYGQERKFVYQIGAEKFIVGDVWESFFAWDWCGTGRIYEDKAIAPGGVFEFPEKIHLSKGRIRIKAPFRIGDKVHRVEFVFDNPTGDEILTITESGIRAKEEEAKRRERQREALIKDTATLKQIANIPDLQNRLGKLIVFDKAPHDLSAEDLRPFRQKIEGEIDLAKDLIKKGFTGFGADGLLIKRAAINTANDQPSTSR